MLHVCDIAKSSCNIHVLHESLTARPSAEQGSCSALGLFFFFLVLVVTHTKSFLAKIIVVGTFNHATHLMFLFGKSC